MPRLLLLRGPARAGKSTLGRSLNGRSPDYFVVIETDQLAPPPEFPNPPRTNAEGVARRIAQVILWGQHVRGQFSNGKSVLLDCDLQFPWEASLLGPSIGIQLPGPEVLVIRLNVSVATATGRRANLSPETVANLHQNWSAPSLGFDDEVQTDGVDPAEVERSVLSLVRAKWPAV
jgi:hypothetical protein